MFLVRHNRLLPPFHDYTTLTANMLDRLANGDVSPDIAPLPEKIPWDDRTLQIFKDAELFVCSGSNRTQQTCLALMERYGIEKGIIVDSDLNEIFFIPSKLMDTSSENPLEAVRKKLYAQIASNGSGVEPLAALHNRIMELFKKYKSEKCVLLSHGFLMRLISSYCLQKQAIDKALTHINAVAAIDYLGCTDV